MKRKTLLAPIALLLLLPEGSAAAEKKKNAVPVPTAVGSVDASGVYQMSGEELDFDCKKLTGRVQIRILQLRSGPGRPTSALSQTMQRTTKPIFGGTLYGTDAAGQERSDRAMLEAYNKRLREKNCKSFDLAAALASKDGDTPDPTVAPPDPSKKPEPGRKKSKPLPLAGATPAPSQGDGKSSPVRPETK